MLVICNPVCVRDYSVGLVEVGKHIQRARSTIPSVRLVFYPHEVVLDVAHKLFLKGAVYVLKGVKRENGRVVSIIDGRCFGSGGDFRDDRRRSGIGRGKNPCFQKGCLDGGGKGEAKVYERAAANICVDRRRVRFEDIVHGVYCGVRRFAVNWWYCGFFEALDKLIDGGGCQGGGEELINN